MYLERARFPDYNLQGDKEAVGKREVNKLWGRAKVARLGRVSVKSEIPGLPER